MSKSKGTAINPDEVIKKHGRDVLRYFLLRYNPTEDFAFSWEKCAEGERFMNTLQNCVRFLKLYSKQEPMPSKLEPEDEWIVSRVNSLQKQVEEANREFHGFKALELIEEFVTNDFSRWYIKLVRDRTWPTYKGKDKKAAFATLHYVTKKTLLLLAPAIPYSTEEMNQTLYAQESIHLQAWPELEKQKINSELEEQMQAVRNITEACLNARQEAGIKLRWPLPSLSVETKEKSVSTALKKFGKLLEKTCNVKKVGPGKNKGVKTAFEGGTVYLETRLDGQLLEEALANELTRKIQSMRKKQGMKVGQKIRLFVHSNPKTNKMLEKIGDTVSKKVNASTYSLGEKGKHATQINFKNTKITISFSKKK
jgi:isoleucyl-tRNA synthetase